MTCPRCGHAQIFDGPECERCGVIFARLRDAGGSAAPWAAELPVAPAAKRTPGWEAAPPAEAEAAVRIAAATDAEPAVDRAGWWALAVGAGLAALTQVAPVLEVLVGYFTVLVHELGHAAAGWLLGYPSVPAFDFTYGGGVTAHLDRDPVLAAVPYAGFAFLAWVFRRNLLSLGLVIGVAGAWALLHTTGWDRAVILAMGHGGELLFAGLFLHRALSGRAVHVAAERPLYAWLGLHVVFYDVGFAWELATNSAARAAYAHAKGGGHWMDFSRLAREFLGVPLETVAAAFLVVCLLTPVAAIVGNLYRHRVAEALQRLARVE